MKNTFKFLFATILFVVQAQAMQDDSLHLVVGSTREKGHTSQIFEKIVGPGVDFSQKNSFDGRATTLDLLSCAISGQRHIKHDARTFDPGKKVLIRAVYMELFPSAEKVHVGFFSTKPSKSHPPKELMLMPQVIENLAKYMCDGATLEIEHWPNIATRADSEFLEQCHAWNGQSIHELNPFHCFISPEFFMPFIDSVLKNPSGEAEKWLFDKKALISAIENIQKLMSLTPEEVKITVGKEYSQHFSNHLFFETTSETLSMLLLQEFTMLTQRNLIGQFLERIGFKDIKIDRGASRLNGRQNIWMISAVRINGKVVPTSK